MKKTISKLIVFILVMTMLLSTAVCAGAEENLRIPEGGSLLDADIAAECASSAGVDAEFAPQADNMGIFALKVSKGTDVVNMGAFLVEAGGEHFLLAHSEIVDYLNEGYDLTLMSIDGNNIPAICAAYTDSGIAFLYAEGMEYYNPLTFSQEPLTNTIAAGLVYTNDNSTKALRIEYKAFDFSQWTQISEFYFAKADQTAAYQWLGCPVFPNTRDYDVQGIGTYAEDSDGDLVIAVLSFAGVSLDADYSLRGIVTRSNGEPPASEPVVADTPVPEEPESGNKTYLIIGACFIVGVIFYYFANRKKPEEESGETMPLTPVIPAQSTIPLEKTVPLEPDATHAVTRPMSGWQLRSQGGALGNNVFPLSSTTVIGRSSKCDIRFPDGTAGISGSHCQVSVEGDRVILRDLGSSYGTFVSGTRLVPNMDQPLYAGDTFTLAQNGPTFRLERIGGGSDQRKGPAVRDMNGKIYTAGASGRLTFGRKGDSIVRYPDSDKAVSGNHCVLYREGGKLYLMDNGSTNGTFFNANERLKPNKPYRINKGQSFFLANAKNTYVVTED